MKMPTAQYEIGENRSEKVTVDKNKVSRTHDWCEIMLFLDVDAKIHIEEKKYFLKPFDVVIIREKELHRFYRHVPSTYKRIILSVYSDFYEKNNCEEYKYIFKKDYEIKSHKIPAEIVKSSGLYDAFIRYKEYSRNYTMPEDTPVLRAIVVELLYLIHKCFHYVKEDAVKDSIKPILAYLDKNYSKDITLDKLSEQFYISKQYLCKAFLESTGVTVYRYLQKKRLLRVRELKRDGVNIATAISQAGFKNYSAFYRAYKKEYGITPKKGLG